MGFGGWGDEDDMGGIEGGEPWSEYIAILHEKYIFN